MNKNTHYPKAHHEIRVGTEKNFGLVFTLVFIIIGFSPLVLTSGSLRWWALLVALLIFLITITAPKRLTFLKNLWFHTGIALGRIISPVIMFFVFFGLVTPIALLARACGKDFLRKHKNIRLRKSFWVKREKTADNLTNMRNQF